MSSAPGFVSGDHWITSLSETFGRYLGHRRLEEVECIIPDLAGMSRGKAMPSQKFRPEGTIYLPVSIFYQTISGEWVNMPEIENQWLESDIVLRPDMDTATAVPWADEPTMQVICDAETREGEVLPFAPRNVLKRVLGLYAERGWRPVVAPELEFYLTEPNIDPDLPIEPPAGRTGRKGAARQAFSMVAVDEYGEVIDTIYDFAEAQGFQIDTVIQEGGAGQIEINLMHGDPLKLADEVFYFKRTIREAALKKGVFATFMAKPMRDEPGSAMHIHQSVVDAVTGRNLFNGPGDQPTDAFRHFIGGSQRYLLHAAPLLLPYVNSYRRITAVGMAAPSNLEWAADNRSTGLRVPNGPPESRRLENRVIGSDCNPYLAIAASLACGYLGMVEKIEPSPAAQKFVDESEFALPTSLSDALDLFAEGGALREVLGEEFCTLYQNIKRAENEEYQREITPWEREHLLLNA
ncbi:glutamine synthetase [Meinhardsimonia xiamenensis]|jgi:glutamine synthetase|uniref:Glutamine synthetase n=1 Tax=Meinhardsimonia xiamenensis TaxID=990712 RepID=A0A1G8YR62_9RHOB|nr:glutamine synthetase [Meinhardsimonia xiamenensis]SDK05288.1 glutamine synthetase [Meinhardsimonia xiamenensis]